MNKDNSFVKELKNGKVHTYVDGYLNSVNNKPSMVNKDGSEKSWHVNGLRERSGDKPAFISRTVDDRRPGRDYVEHSVIKKWYKKGLIHRETDYPAYIKVHKGEDGVNKRYTTLTAKEWYKKGAVHRDGDKPALIKRIVINEPEIRTVITKKKWYTGGNLHRDGDKPAIITQTIYYDKEGNITQTFNEQEFYKKGLLHRKQDLPAVIRRGRLKFPDKKATKINVYKGYYLNNKEHRDTDKPAILSKDYLLKDTGEKIITEISESFFVNGQRHRENNKIAYLNKKFTDDGLLEYVKKIYFLNNERHRDNDKVAYYELRPDAEIFVCYNYGRLNRKQLPAVIMETEDKKYFQFHNFGVENKNPNVSLQFLKDEILKIDSSLDRKSLENHPASQLFSILNTISDKEYSQDAPLGEIDNMNIEGGYF